MLNLKDAHDLFLEQERDRVLTKKILTLQRAIKGWYYRRKFLTLRKNAIVIQRYWRGFIQRKKYKAVSKATQDNPMGLSIKEREKSSSEEFHCIITIAYLSIVI